MTPCASTSSPLSRVLWTNAIGSVEQPAYSRARLTAPRSGATTTELSPIERCDGSRQQRHGCQVIDRHVEEPFDRRRMRVDQHQPIESGGRR